MQTSAFEHRVLCKFGGVNEFPPIRLTECDVEQSVQWSGLRDVTPYVDRPPYKDWSALFYQACEEDPALDWKGAGFVRCKPDDVEAVEARLAELVAKTNDKFGAFLARAEPRGAAEQLLELEGINAASVDGNSYRIV
jgi:hypothetical protein